MKRFVIIITIAFSWYANAQLGAPVNSQKDTFYSQSALYNSTELNSADWPSQYIVEDATSIFVAGYEYVKGEVIYDSYSSTCKEKHCYKEIYEFDYKAMCNGKKSTIKIFKHKNDDGTCMRRYVIDGYEFYAKKRGSVNPTTTYEYTEIYTVVETDPQFPGDINKYIEDNLKYPQLARDNNITGRVYVTFVVEQDGSLTGVRVLRDIGGGCGAEAIRLVNTMPKWIPGKQRGKPVRVQYNLPINFH